MQWINPLPVAVALLPASGGLIVVRRTIEPEYGKFALPGGYIDWGETWQQAAAREVLEETGLVVSADDVEHVETRSTSSGTRINIFGILPNLGNYMDLPPFTPTDETDVRKVIYEPTELAFGSHTEIARAFFRKQWNPPI